MVLLRYDNGGWPANATVQVTVSRPNAGAGNLLSQSRLRTPATLDGDTLSARQSTLTALQLETGQALVIYTEETFDLSDDSENTNGSFEAAARFIKPLKDLLSSMR